VNPSFCENMEVTRVPPGRPSRTTSGTRATGWEPLVYGKKSLPSKESHTLRSYRVSISPTM